MKIPLARPDITEREIAAVSAVLRTPNLALGPKLREFEEKIADYVGVKYAVGVNSGTSALHLIIRALEIGEGDEVITTAFSFISSASCSLFERATPVFADIKPDTMNIDPDRIEEKITNKTRAILAVDVFGHPADWDKLRDIANCNNLALIEDSAEALGAEYLSRESKVQSPKSRVESRESKPSNQSGQTEGEWKKAGSFGDAAVFAFYPNKQITTGEGGMIVTDDEHIAGLCRSMSNQGRREGNGWHEHERLGYNYRLSDINCALGVAQLQRIEEILAKRKHVAQMYSKRLKYVTGVEIPYVSKRVKMSWFVYVVRLSDHYRRDDVLQQLKRKGIGCSDYFRPIHLQPLYRALGYTKGDLHITENIGSRTVALPFHSNLSQREVDYVVENLDAILGS